MRVRIAFLFLFVSVAALSVGAHFITGLGKVQESIAARESQARLQDITDPKQRDEALRRHPSNRILQMAAMAAKAAEETSAAAEKLSAEVEPPGLSSGIDLGTASRAELEALRRDLKIAETNATALVPRYIALIKAERDKVATYARSLYAEKRVVDGFLDRVDKRHAKITTLASGMLQARAEYYRAYEAYVAVLFGEFGAYKVVNGQFIFPLKPTVDRYNVAAHAMTVAAKRAAELEEETRKLMQPQPEEWEQFVNSND
jgi:hypothetical protein